VRARDGRNNRSSRQDLMPHRMDWYYLVPVGHLSSLVLSIMCGSESSSAYHLCTYIRGLLCGECGAVEMFKLRFWFFRPE
jgi:hypothetical protein